jgi:hypothetical protein
MFNCCGKDVQSLCGQLACTAKETPNGIHVEIAAKDPAKTESLKALIKSVREFCGCC